MSDTQNKGQRSVPKKQPKQSSKDHIFRKRNPPKPERDDSVIYVSTKTHIKALLQKCNKLIGENASEIVIYCLGAAIQRGILLALQICEEHSDFELHTNTLTTELIDDLEPAADDADYEIQKRFNSALRIKLSRKDLLETKENN
ncbi:unnamed protein product [Brassicogethes aeneus]|uniref:Uncharacterized protein n=1 Tax=Brassicogethes aeneus TaxID=1431903 RepID=A0A9P0BIQ0_BRAAE|nr:unnamed protein product [Brassicogethes aeneus]